MFDKRALVIALPLFAWAGVARANGLEAPTTSASAKWSAVGGASASRVDGPDALVLNPAGLARSSSFELVLNAQPALNVASAPIAAPNQSVDAKKAIAPMAELLASFSPMENLGIGAGVNVAGGQGADYGTVAFGPKTSLPFSEMLGAFEGSLGAGYRVTKNLSLGATWRITYQRATIHAAFPTPAGVAPLDVEGASGTSFAGFRAGAQWRADDDRWGLGVSFRSPVTWKIEGDAANVGPFASSFEFPLQVAAGGDVAVGDHLRVMGQYSWSRYSANDFQPTTILGQTAMMPLHWHDRHTAQIGAEYAIDRVALRAGYIFESQVVPGAYPSPYGPPSTGNTFAIGAGMPIGDHFRVDVAAIVSPQSATVTAVAPDAASPPGTYSVTSYVGALSLGYRM